MSNSNKFFPSIPFAGNIARGASSKSLAEIKHEYAEKSDAELVASFLAGNDATFAALVDRHLSLVYTFVYRYLGNADDTADVVQESFIKVWKNIKRFDVEKNFKTWLLTIAKNTALDFIKKKKPILFSKIEEGDGDLDVFLAPYVETVGFPDRIMEGKQAAAELEAAMAKLGPSYRTILSLRYGEHLKFREIAEVLEEPIDTIKSKHRRGLIMLRKLIAE